MMKDQALALKSEVLAQVGRAGKSVVEVTPQGCGQLFAEYGTHTEDDSVLFKRPQDVALVVFTGGHDVTPELYGENVGRYTAISWERDLYEGRRFDQALRHNIPMVGICRGAQFLCVKAGGKLVQHVTNHGGAVHTVRTSDGRTFGVNSSHHQMQLPGEAGIPLAWSDPRLSKCYLNGDDDEQEVPMEYEVVHYPGIGAVGIQYHPEWHSCPKAGIDYAKEVVRENLFGGVAKAA